MNECDDSVDKSALPSERAQPPQPIQTGNDRAAPVQRGSFLAEIIDVKGTDGPEAGARKRTPVLDNARFTAGVISFYEAVLSEPIPEKMLRLIEEIGMQERKS